jgi:hypothetical protein
VTPATSLPEPVFVLADDDEAALGQMTRMLTPDWFFIPVSRADCVLRYSLRFDSTAIFISDNMRFPNGGTARLLRSLVGRTKKPVVILVESWDKETEATWKRRGAFACIPHPTRTGERMKLLRETMQHVYLGADRP